MNKLITIIAWLVLILISPIIAILTMIVGVFISMEVIFKEVINIFDYQIVPYIRWKFNDVRERFRKKDSN